MCAPTEDDLPRRPQDPVIDVGTDGIEGFQVGLTDAEEKRRRDRRGDTGIRKLAPCGKRDIPTLLVSLFCLPVPYPLPQCTVHSIRYIV